MLIAVKRMLTYDKAELDQYTTYLESRGFTYYRSTAIDGGEKIAYTKGNEGLMVLMEVVAIQNGSDLLGIVVGRIS